MPHPRKFILVNNGLRDQLGHYFETSVSVAEAAWRAGFHPVLGAHVQCRRELVPDWLECHCAFRTDHWMRDDLPIEASVDSVRRPWKANTEKAWAFFRRGMRLAERSAYYLFPPLIYDAARLLGYCCLPRIVSPACRERAAVGLRRFGYRLRHGQHAALIEQAAAWRELRQILSQPLPPTRVVSAALRLLPEGLGRELEYALIFFQDLQTFLGKAAVGPHDHVLLPTAHTREVLAVQMAVEQRAEQSPTFHLEFRHPLFERDRVTGDPIISPNTRMQAAFLSLHAEWGTTDRIRFYTDSQRLSEDYESLTELSFGTLPLPFRAELLPVAPRSDLPVRIVYLGGARDEKGFHWLPDLIQKLAEDYFATSKARLLIQASLAQPEHNPRSVAALRKLKRRPLPGVELVALDGALDAEKYYALAAQADIMLLPYLRERYRACTSGVLAEALAVGAAAVVPAGTWLADQLPPGGGETFNDFASFVDAVKRVVDNIADYRMAAKANRPSWLKRHSPDALVAALLEQENDSGRAKLAA